MSLWKKLFDHKENSCHRPGKSAEGAQNETLENVCIISLSHEKEINSQRSSCDKEVAKEKQSIKNFEDEINMPELNGICMGHIHHSTNASINIVSHIASEMRNKLVKIVCPKGRISLISDESTTTNKKSMLILYVQVFIPDFRMSAPVNLFLVMMSQLKGVFRLLLQHLQHYGMTRHYLSKCSVYIACCDALKFFGVNRTDERKTSLVWHCVKHGLELSVCFAVCAVLGINEFRSFIDKLYVLYHASPKNSMCMCVVAGTKIIDS
jgi:hypothetical protein